MTEETGIPQTSLNPTAPPFQINMLPTNNQQTVPLIQQQQTPSTVELELFIKSVVQQTLASNNNTEFVDETFTNNSNLEDLDKIPDLVKTIRDFNGERTEYTAWRKSVDRVLTLYSHLQGTAKYFGIISVIRNKIIGNANIALESYNTPLNWAAIKQCLNTHYTDRRDIGTLEYQLTTLVQGRNSIETFYQKVYSHLSMMLNSISSMELDRNTEKAFINSYRNKALDTFIRGLNGDLPNLLAVREPKDLPEALHLCTRLANQNFRTHYANTQAYVPTQIQPRHAPNTYNNPKLQNRNAPNNYPPINHTPKNYYANNQTSFSHQTNKYPPINHTPMNYYANNQTPQNHQTNNYPPTNQFRAQSFLKNFNPNQVQNPQNFMQPPNSYPQGSNPPARPTAPKPRNYEPMDVDHSLNSKMISYVNRPQNQNWATPQNKQPNFNIHANDNTEQDEIFLAYAQQYEMQEEKQGENQQQQMYNSDCIDTTDVHFLD